MYGKHFKQDSADLEKSRQHHSGCTPTMENVLITAARKSGEGKQFELLWQDLELSDVTLVCNDGSQVMAHKTVLALSSPLLRDIFT